MKALSHEGGMYELISLIGYKQLHVIVDFNLIFQFVTSVT